MTAPGVIVDLERVEGKHSRALQLLAGDGGAESPLTDSPDSSPDQRSPSRGATPSFDDAQQVPFGQQGSVSVTYFRLIAFLGLHFLSLLVEVSSMCIFLITGNPMFFTCTLAAFLFSGLFCAWAAWSSPASFGNCMPVKDCPRCYVVPLLLILGLGQGVVVILAIDEFKAARGLQPTGAQSAKIAQQGGSKYHVKAVLGLFEGLVTSSVLLYFLATTGYPEHHPITGPLPHWFPGGHAGLCVLVFISFLSWALSLLELDLCVSSNVSKRFRQEQYYTVWHFLFRCSEVVARAFIYLSYVMLIRTSKDAPSGDFLRILFWVPAMIELVGTLVVIYLCGGAERRGIIQLVCCTTAWFVNIFEFVDSPYKRRAARTLSWWLTLRNLVTAVIYIAVTSLKGYIQEAIKNENWQDHSVLFVSTPIAVGMYWMLLACIRCRSTDTIDLYSACERGKVSDVFDAMNGLLDSVAVRLNVNTPDIDGKTPLMLAAGSGHADVCMFLLKEGAKVDAKITEDHRVLINWLRRPVRDRWTAVHLAARGGHHEVMRVLLGLPGTNAADTEEWARRMELDVRRASKTPCWQDEQMETPLHTAAWSGQVRVARLLAQHCPHWKEVANLKGQKPIDVARGVEVQRAILEPWVIPEAESSENGHVESAQLMNTLTDLTTPSAQDTEFWPQQQLAISRRFLDGIQLKAPGLCSYVAGSCGGALARVFLVTVTSQQERRPIGLGGLSAIMEETDGYGWDETVEVSHGGAFAGSHDAGPALGDLEPVDSNQEPVREWVAWSLSGNFQLGHLLSMVPRVALLGKGSYGTVWRAREQHSHSLYAIKNVNTRRGSTLGNVAARECQISDFVRLKPHPCIVKLFSVANFPDMDLYLLVMEFCPNGDVLRRIRQARETSDPGTYQAPPRALLWVGQIFLALEHMHKRMTTLLRDLKPENVVLSLGDHAKLTDFGLGRFGVESAGMWTFGFPTGSPGYIAPEVLKQEQYDYRADLYSLGVLVWVLLTGGMPNVSDPVPPIGRGRNNRDFTAHFNDYKKIQECIDQPTANGARALEPSAARDFVSRLTKRKPGRRMEHDEIRKHELLRHLELPSFQAAPSVVETWLSKSAVDTAASR